jgi:phosphatidylserine/phosphatidylglycerophosphate/cardiolipin synthase-like enzyme
VISGALTSQTDDLLPVPAGSTLNTLVVLNRRLGWLPSVGGNKADLFSDYEEAIAAMARDVRTAERYVHVEFYIMSWDATTHDFFEALAEVAARGVTVRLMLDIRSFNLDFEISVMCLSRSLTTAMREVEDLYRSLSRELTLDEWYRRPLGKRYIDNVMRLTSALQ